MGYFGVVCFSPLQLDFVQKCLRIFGSSMPCLVLVSFLNLSGVIFYFFQVCGRGRTSLVGIGSIFRLSGCSKTIKFGSMEES